MTEHRIRLRGGWRWVEPETRDAGRPVTLPIVWPVGRTTSVHLIRSFQRPPIDPRREALALHLEDVPGLAAVWLNDRALAQPSPGTSTLWIPLNEPLPARNLLVLDVDPSRARDPETAGSPWGTIALVIRPADPPTGRPELLGETGPPP